MKKAAMHLISRSVAPSAGLAGASHGLMAAASISAAQQHSLPLALSNHRRHTAAAASPPAHPLVDYSIEHAALPALSDWREPLVPAIPAPSAALTLGYAADNTTLRRAKKIFTSRTCQRRTFETNGISHISGLALQNCLDLEHVVRWNHENGINFFRLSSKLFPWAGEYELETLPDFPAICDALASAGQLARALGQRITSHPPHFIKLAATNETLRKRSVADLEVQSRVFDLMGFPPSHWNKINIHVGGTYGSKSRSIARFAQTFESLSDPLRARLTIENDDRATSYSVLDLTQLHSITGIPITFDFHHHQFCDGGQSQAEALETAIATWPRGIRPVVHWSEPPECPVRGRTHPYAHSNFVYGPIQLHGRESDVDVMIESKAREVALLLYRDEIAPRLAKETNNNAEKELCAASG